jgi:hypothetical protein
VAHSPAFQSSRPESADLLWVVGIEDDVKNESPVSRGYGRRTPRVKKGPDHPVYE